MRHSKTRRSGFTLIEIMIVVIVLTLLFLTVMGTFTAGQAACSIGNANLNLQMTSTRCMSEMTRRLRAARILQYDDVTGMWLDFQVPVDHDGDGDILDDDNLVEWGAERNVGWYYRYAYVKRGEFDESDQGVDGVDLNRDGDTGDDWSLGSIVEQLYSDTGILMRTRWLSPSCVVTTPEGWGFGGDVNGDWAPDPLFTRLTREGNTDPTAGTNVRVSFFSFRQTPQQRTVFRRCTSIVATVE